MDSSIVFFLRADSSTIVLVWIRRLLPIKLGSMAAFLLLCFRMRPQPLWIRPLFFFVVVLSTVSGQIRLPHKKIWEYICLLGSSSGCFQTIVMLAFFNTVAIHL